MLLVPPSASIHSPSQRRHRPLKLSGLQPPTTLRTNEGPGPASKEVHVRQRLRRLSNPHSHPLPQPRVSLEARTTSWVPRGYPSGARRYLLSPSPATCSWPTPPLPSAQCNARAPPGQEQRTAGGASGGRAPRSEVEGAGGAAGGSYPGRQLVPAHTAAHTWRTLCDARDVRFPATPSLDGWRCCSRRCQHPARCPAALQLSPARRSAPRPLTRHSLLPSVPVAVEVLPDAEHWPRGPDILRTHHTHRLLSSAAHSNPSSDALPFSDRPALPQLPTRSHLPSATAPGLCTCRRNPWCCRSGTHRSPHPTVATEATLQRRAATITPPQPPRASSRQGTLPGPPLAVNRKRVAQSHSDFSPMSARVRKGDKACPKASVGAKGSTCTRGFVWSMSGAKQAFSPVSAAPQVQLSRQNFSASRGAHFQSSYKPCC